MLNDFIHQLILVPIFINICIHTLRNHICRVLSLSTVREHHIINPRIQHWIIILCSCHYTISIFVTGHDLGRAHVLAVNRKKYLSIDVLIIVIKIVTRHLMFLPWVIIRIGRWYIKVIT